MPAVAVVVAVSDAVGSSLTATVTFLEGISFEREAGASHYGA